jgi:aspartate racemase
MSYEAILSELRVRQIRLWEDGGRLRCSAPKGAMTPELEQAISNHKSELLGLLKGAIPGVRDPVRRAARAATMPLSFAQEGLWFLNKLHPGCSLNIAAYKAIIGEVDEKTLERAVAAVVARHEVLRTSVPEDGGAPAASIAPSVQTPFTVVDVPGGTRPVVERLAQQPFDLSRAPLLRTFLLRQQGAPSVFAVVMHRIISDCWSIGVLLNELRLAYDALARGAEPSWPELPTQYADYTAWQREQVKGERLASELDYWERKLKGCPTVLELPGDRSGATAPDRSSEVHTFSLGSSVSEGIQALCTSERATLYMVLLSIFNAMLFRYTNQTSILIGVPVANRVRPEFEDLIGLFVNTLVIRTDLDRQQTARSLVRQVRESVLELLAHSEVPFEKIVERVRPERNTTSNPLFQVALVLQNTPHSSEYLTVSGGATFDLTLCAWKNQDGLILLTFEYNIEMFDPTTVERMSCHFTNLAAAFASNPDQSIGRLRLLGAAEEQQLICDWNQTVVDYPRGATIHGLFAEQAARTPRAVALTETGESVKDWTYEELDRRSSQLAHMLVEAGAGPEVAVAVALDRSATAVLAFLAVLKAGAAYVPLDPSYPAQRLEYLLRDSEARILIISERDLEAMPPFDGPCVVLDRDAATLFGGNHRSVENLAGAETLAYVMYTSGSTGELKGVCVVHRGVVRLVKGANYARLSSEDVILACSPVTFDASTFEIWGALLNGGRVVIERERMPTVESLRRAIRQYGVTTLWLTAGLFHRIVEADPSTFRGLHQLLAGGGVLSVSHVNRVLEVLGEGVFVNGYGPTENTTFTCCHCMAGGTRVERTVPIGRPISNTRVYLLDQDLQPVPVGVAGELYAGGDGLARGYLRAAERTAERFLADPFADQPGARMYRTGDLARYRPDGTIEFIGRVDHQVKIRGHRVELGAIETTLSKHPAVREAVVVAREALPLTPNGKIDRKAMPAPERTLQGDEVWFVAPRNPTEELLSQTWAEVLHRQQVSTYDDFFDLGGNSLSGVSMMAAIQQRFGVKLPLQVLFETPTVAGLAARLSAVMGGTHPDASGTSPGASGRPQPRTKTEHRLLEIWERHLQVRPIGIRDSFYALKGSSSLLDQMLAEVRSSFGLLAEGLPVKGFLETPTIEALAQIIDGPLELSSSLVVSLQPRGSERPLFLIHAGGGYVFFYRALASRLGTHRPVYGIRAEMRSDGLGRPFTSSKSIEEIAARYIAEIKTVQRKGPYSLGGGCLGGVVAFEMARQLQSRGEDVVGPVLLFDSFVMNNPRDVDWFPPWSTNHLDYLKRRFALHLDRAVQLGLVGAVRYLSEKFWRLARSEITWAIRAVSDGLRTLSSKALGKLGSSASRAQETAAPHEAYQRSLTEEGILKSATRLLWRYIPGQYGGSIALFKCAGVYDAEPSWTGLARGGMSVHKMPGTHLDMMEEPAVIETAAIVSEYLARE